MANKVFSIQIGSLLFKKKSISFIVAGVFLLGLLMGILSIIHIENPQTSFLYLMPIFWASVIPIVIIFKGIRKAVVIT